MADLIVPEVVQLPDEPWSDEFAKKVVLRDFEAAANYRSTNHEPRWQTAQMIYTAYVKKRNWEGTRIPRASIPVFLAFEQIESLIPRVIREMFADPRWFESFPMRNTPAEVAREVRDLMLYQGDRMRVQETFRRCLKSALIYGNGIAELSMKQETIRRTAYIPYEEPIIRSMPHPILGVVPVPTGVKKRIKREKITEEIKQPWVSYVSIFDFYIDPLCASPFVRDARFACRRALKYVDELLELKGQPGFKIPDKAELLALAKDKASTQGDMIKGQSEAGGYGWWTPTVDSSSDPAAARVEIIAYYTKDRVVWLAGRDKVIYNVPNPMGFIPFYNIGYADMLDRFYCVALTDVVEGEQKLQEGIINGRLDELSLSIHTPMAKKRGVAVSPYQLRRRPDQVLESEDPQKDFFPMFPQNITQQAYVEVTASELRAQKATGVTDLAVLGAPTTGGNSANRTATGVNQQAQAASSRIEYLVANTECTFVEPLLEDWHTLNALYLDPEKTQEILGPDSQLAQVENINVMNAQVKLSMRASRRMRSKQALSMNFAQLAQTILNPAFMQQLASQQQKTINIDEFSSLLFDAIDYPSKKSLFRNMTQEELQSMNQPPTEVLIKKEMQDDKLDAQADMKEMETTGKLMQEIVKAQARGSKAPAEGGAE